MRSKVPFWVLVIGLVLWWGGMAGSLEAAVYKFTNLGMGFPNDPGDAVTALTDANQIVGFYYMGAPNGGKQGYFADLVKQTFIWLQPFSGDYPNSIASGINKLGQIVGSCSNAQDTVSVACVWTDPSQPPTMLSTLPGYTSGYASAINDNGLIVGASFNDDGLGHACKWTMTAPDQPVDLGITQGGTGSWANTVNNAGQIVGSALDDWGHDWACLWEAGQTTPQVLNTSLWMTYATGINSLGNVVGWGQGELQGNYGFFWDHQTAQTQVFSPGQELNGIITGPGDANQVVGNIWSADGFFFWTPSGGLKDLNQMIVNLPPGVTVDSVNRISPKGNILGTFSDNFGGNSCLLTPIAALPGLDLLLMN